MKTISAADLVQHLDVVSLVDALEAAFRQNIIAPLRQHYTMPRHGEPDAVLLTMPAWSDRTTGEDVHPVIGVKLVTLVPGNSARNVGNVLGSYILMSGITGEPLAVIDGTTLTHLRTAAASALAARYLARPDSRRLVMVGAGAMAPHLIRAHAAIRPITDVAIWARDAAKAEALAASIADRFATSIVSDLDAAIADADIISAATMSPHALIHGRFLKEGAHVDLVGAYTPAMRESDDDTVRRARIFVDTIEGATHEAGDIVQPLEDHVIERGDIEGDLFDLTAGRAMGRVHAEEITLFKSVGTALEDLAAARLAYQRVTG
jgi:ornithine cyclodeaminase